MLSYLSPLRRLCWSDLFNTVQLALCLTSRFLRLLQPPYSGAWRQLIALSSSANRARSEWTQWNSPLMARSFKLLTGLLTARKNAKRLCRQGQGSAANRFGKTTTAQGRQKIVLVKTCIHRRKMNCPRNFLSSKLLSIVKNLVGLFLSVQTNLPRTTMLR